MILFYRAFFGWGLTYMEKKSRLTRIREWIGYMLALSFIVIFALYCSGRVGWFLLIVAVALPLLSAVITRVYAHLISIDVDIEETMLAKNNHCTLLVKVKNESFLPTPDILIYFLRNDHCNTADTCVSIAVGPRRTLQFTVDYEALYAGGSCLGVDRVYVKSLIGDGSVRIADSRINNKSWVVGIIPEISYIPSDDPVIANVFSATISDNSNDETVDETSLMFGGFPGYEYREYQPGDPLKRINSKLSAKKGTLMVRLDERMATSSVALVLDPAMMCEYSALLVQSTLESLLGIAQTCMQREYAVEVYVHCDELWEKQVLLQENDLIQLSHRLSSYTFAKSDDRFPEEREGAGSTSIVYCTPRLDATLEGILQTVRSGNCDNLSVYEVSASDRDDISLYEANSRDRDNISLREVNSRDRDNISPYEVSSRDGGGI